MAGAVEQQLPVVAEIGVAAELLHEPGGVVPGGDLRHEDHQLLSLTEGGLQKAEGVVEHGLRLHGHGLAPLHLLAEPAPDGVHGSLRRRGLPIQPPAIVLQRVDLPLPEVPGLLVQLAGLLGLLHGGAALPQQLVQHRQGRRVGDLLPELGERLVEGVGEGVLPAGVPGLLAEAGEHQPHDGELLVKGGLPQLQHGDVLPRAAEDILHVVGLLVLVEQLQVIGEVLGDAGHLDVLPHHLPVRPDAQFFIGVEELAQVLPAPGGGELEAVRRVLDAVEVVLLDVQVGEDGPVKVLPAGVFLPHAVVLLHVDALHPVQRHHVKVPDGLVVLRRVARRHDEPPLRQGLVAEGLALEELEHHGGQGLADAVDLVQEEDALFQPGPLHQPVDGCQDLAHGVLGDGDLLPAVGALFDEGQADGTLPGVMGDGVGH